MKKRYHIFLLLLLPAVVAGQSPVDYVQPLSGTAASTTVSALKHSDVGSERNANTIPVVTLPFAMTQWTPETRLTENKCVAPYYYKDTALTGFRASHWISGSCTQDYGSMTIVPISGTFHSSETAISFRHENETTTPYYYSVRLPEAGFLVEMTATLRAGYMRITMLRDDSLHVLIRPNSDQKESKIYLNQGVVVSNPVHRIYQGWGQKAGFSGWHYIKTSTKNMRTRLIEGSDQLKVAVISGAFKKGEQVLLEIGTSFSSDENARKNLATEIGAKSFEQVQQEAKDVWNSALSQLHVESESKQDKTIFYTALYHSMQHPRLFSDVNGVYPAFSAGSRKIKQGKQAYYDDFSMWDIYRAQLPLVEILNPSLAGAFNASLVLKGEQGGWLPIFPCWNSYTAAMIGDHSVSVLASAIAKGIKGFDYQKAWTLIRKNAFETPGDLSVYRNGMGRRALTSYLKYGYIPIEDSVPDAFHKKEQVSRTLEYAYDDYAASVVAATLKKKEANTLLFRSKNYQKVFDTTVGLMNARYSTGSFLYPFQPDTRTSYITEGTSRQYSFYVPHDIQGLQQVMGGADVFEKKLDTLFAKGEYWHGNEPGHQIPFLYNFTSSPWKTQDLIRKIRSEEYTDGAGGLSGNDDAGQMSAWYVFAALGFYPVNPVSGHYQLCVPQFNKVVIRLKNGKQFKVLVDQNSKSKKYIESVLWNGEAYNKNFITYTMIQNGGELSIRLSDTPTSWGSKKENRSNL